MARISNVDVTTDSAGDATVYLGPHNGRVRMVKYTKTDFADTADFTITSNVTGQQIWTESNVTASKTVYPRIILQDNAGADLTYDGTRKVHDYIWLDYEEIKIVIAQGGDTKTGNFKALVDD